VTAPGLSGLAKLLFDHAWDGYAGGEVMCECKWSSADGDPSVQKYDAYTRHLEDVTREAGWVGPDQHRVMVERAEFATEVASRHKAAVCRVRALIDDAPLPHASGRWVVRVDNVRDALEYPEEKL
jgi:hypothetical protein